VSVLSVPYSSRRPATFAVKWRLPDREVGTPMSNVKASPFIRELPPSMRPRERLWHSGVEALESREILALLLRTGTRSVSALALADRLLARFHSLEGVLLASLEELTSVPGVGPAKASQIKAAYEAGRRLQRPREKDVPIRSAADAVAYVMPKLRLL